MTHLAVINVLVTSISGKVPLLKALRKALGRIAVNGKIVGGDLDDKCIGRYFVNTFWKMPRLKDLEVEQLVDYCKQNWITAIIPTRDGELPYFAKNRERLERENITAMISPLSGVQACFDKLAFYENLQNQLEIQAIPTAVNINSLTASSYVMKERYGAGAQKMAIGVSKEEAVKHAMSLDSPVFQPYIAGREFCIDVYITRNGQPKGAVTRSRDVVINGESQVTTTVRQPELEKACFTVAAALDLQGHLVFQALQDADNRFHLIECNCRFGGASTLSVAAGLDSFYWFLLESQGEDISRYPFARSPKELRQIRHAEDLVIHDPGF